VAVAAAKAKNCWPCGVCRQHLFEVARELDVVIEDESGRLLVEKLSVLLPQLKR
jgi:cytidine deaminase